MGGVVKKKLTAAKLRRAEKLAADGCTRSAIAKAMRISRSKFYDLLATDKAFKDAIETGEEIDLSVCKSVTRERAMNTKNPAWMDRYLYLRHGVKHMNAVSAGGGNVVINLVMPFPTGSNSAAVGATIDGDVVRIDE